MNKEDAYKIVRETLQNKFDKERFIYFAKNLLNKIDDSKAFHAHGYVLEAYKDYIKTYERLGTYTDSEGNKVDILIAYLQRETSLGRARTAQRNFIAHYLKNRDQKDAGLVAFVSPNHEDWRFSLVKMDYKFTEGKGGRVKVKEEFTPARRWSFLVGINEDSHTAQSRLSPILQNDEHNPSLKQLEDAFSIEKVTKEFFEKYRDLFLRAKEALDEVVKNDSKIEKEFEQNGVDTVDFAKKLLGQIVFLYFLQKKGWFGVERGKEWGTGSKRFLRDLFDKKIIHYKNFFNDVLEPLFYDALAIDKSHIDHYNELFKSKIPFLNGGLFDPINNYNWVDTDITLPNELFSNDIKTKEGDNGNGILNIFDRYNFTVKEDEPLEKEVAIDPEMLGKVFENLLAVKDRKSKGTYYTPREIVHYMCEQSLINYLATELSSSVIARSEATKQSLPTKDDIEKLIKHGESVGENEARVEKKGEETSTYYYKLPESVRKYAKLIDEKLANIKVCDPAIGSGAFPVGMMHEIVKARNVLSAYLSPSPNPSHQGRGNYNESPRPLRERDRVRGDLTNVRTIYNFKRDCIQNSLYGVDIDPGAVEIAKLRLWLSLIVDEDDIKQIKPLPNLDYKIVCGNSLLDVEKNLFNSHLFTELEKLKPLLFNETSSKKKQEYKKQIDELISQITNVHKDLSACGDAQAGFDFEIYFSEVFHEKKGFDIMIANPPYVRADSGSKYLAFRKKLEESRIYQTLYEKWDLMVPFIERGLNIANDKGDLVYIVSNAICTSKYALKLLDLIQEKYFTHSINYFEDISVFEAGVIPVVLHIGKSKFYDKTRTIIRHSSFENVVSEVETPIDKFKTLGRDAFRKEYNPLVFKAQTVNLGKICYMSVGMVINADEKIAQGKFTKDELISETKTKIHSRKYIEGKDIDLYIIKRNKYLEWGTRRVPGQLRRATFSELYDRPKIMRGRVTGGIYDDMGLLCNDSIVVFVKFVDLHGVNNKSIQSSIKKINCLSRPQLEKISEKFDLKYLLAVLNSSFAFKYLNNIRRHRLENYFYPDDFRKLPIADISSQEQKPFMEIVDKILAITKSDEYPTNSTKQSKVHDYEKQIDQMVYKLYGLTEEEIKIVEGK